MTRPTYQSTPLSASVNYTPIDITSISSATPVLLHTSDATNVQEIWLDAYNYDTTDGYLYLLFAADNSYNTITIPVPANRGLIPCVKGLRMVGGTTLKAYASAASIISVVGYCNEIVFV